MSLAADTREAVRERPVLYDGLRAGIVNYTAAADALDLDGDREAIATALRRFAAELTDQSTPEVDRSITVRLHSAVDWSTASETLLAVDGLGLGTPTDDSSNDDKPPVDGDSSTALVVTGDVDARLLGEALDRLRIAGIPVDATGFVAETMVLVVPRRDGPTAVQLVERAVGRC